ELAAEHPAVRGVGDLVERPLLQMELHLIERPLRLVEELEGLAQPFEREVLVEDHLVGLEDRVRELARGHAEYARTDAEGLSGREGEEGPVEIEILAVEVPGERLVG